MGLTDTIVAGRAGAVELSGVAIGSSVANPLFFALSGLMFAITPIVAHLFGANRLKDISLKMKEVIWIAMGVGLILTLAYPLAGSLLRFSSIDKEIKGHKKNKSELSSIVAETLAKKAIEKNIKKIYFDRGIYKYHGRVKIFAETLRKNGMEF